MKSVVFAMLNDENSKGGIWTLPKLLSELTVRSWLVETLNCYWLNYSFFKGLRLYHVPTYKHHWTIRKNKKNPSEVFTVFQSYLHILATLDVSTSLLHLIWVHYSQSDYQPNQLIWPACRPGEEINVGWLHFGWRSILIRKILFLIDELNRFLFPRFVFIELKHKLLGLAIFYSSFLDSLSYEFLTCFIYFLSFPNAHACLINSFLWIINMGSNKACTLIVRGKKYTLECMWTVSYCTNGEDW